LVERSGDAFAFNLHEIAGLSTGSASDKEASEKPKEQVEPADSLSRAEKKGGDETSD